MSEKKDEDPGLWVLEDLGNPLGQCISVGGMLQPLDLQAGLKAHVCPR